MLIFSGSVEFSSVAQSCLTLCNSTDCNTPAFRVHHQLLELTQTQVHRVGDAIQPSHPLSSSSPALNLSQHRGLFKWVSSSHEVAKVLEFTQTHVHWVGDAIQPSYPLLSPSSPAFNLSQHQGLFQLVSSLHKVSFSLSISHSNEYSGLISFRTDWLDLLAVQGTLKSLLQHPSSKASIFGAQLSL